MCCLFTCCGWMIDLVQRLWTFTMSCCISSAVCCVLLTSSMSGIALGYNYSLAEYIDLKETNVSIFLKRGVFDDEIADDMDWRRSGRMPVAGHIGENNLRTGSAEDETTTLRSGRRLDDSIFDADDQNKYEGSLMKLTAKPIHQDTPPARVTDDVEMGEIASKYTMGSLDHMKAIQGLVDARRRMGTGGTTASPLATYNVNEHNLPYLPMYANPQEQVNPANNRRFMGAGPGMKAPSINPARFAVPDQSIGAGVNWLVPKKPDKLNKMAMPDYFMVSPTYPPPITLPHAIKTPTIPPTPEVTEGAIIFATRTPASRKPAPTMSDFEKDSAGFNEQFVREGDIPSKNDVFKLPKPIKSPEEEYEDEIKGLPVRKRRDIKSDTLTSNNNNTHEHKFTSISMSNIDFSKIKINATFESVLNISLNNASNNITIDNTVEYDVIKSNSGKNNDVQIDIQTPREEAVKQEIKLDKIVESDPSKAEIISDESTQNISEVKPGKTLLDRIVTVTATKKSTLTTVTEETDLLSAKKTKIQRRRKSFESKIVSSKYSTNNGAARSFDKGQTTISNAELLNSISVNLNEAGLLKNPASSAFVKLLQSTLT